MLVGTRELDGPLDIAGLGQQRLRIIGPAFIEERRFHLTPHRILQISSDAVQQLVPGDGFVSGKEPVLPVKSLSHAFFGPRAPMRGKLSGNEETVVFDEELHGGQVPALEVGIELDRAHDRQTVRAAIEQLPAEFRETITLRELEGMSYKEISLIAGVPIGTVMSRLARAKAYLKGRLGEGGGASR